MKVSNKFLLICFLFTSTCQADNLILLYLKPYPYLEANTIMREQANKLDRPWKLAATGIHVMPMVAGIGATYGGFLTFSDTTGQIAFPRKHPAPKIYLVLTPRITPIIIAHLTIHHWEFEEGTPAEMYEIVRKQDPQSELYFWETKKVDLPKNKIIPLEALVIFSNPKHFYVPTGITLTQKSANLVLPDIYVKRGIKLYSNTLYLLNIKGFFGVENILQQKTDTSYSEIIYAPNIDA